MARIERFTFLCSRKERALITSLAERLQRSQSDAIRFLVLQFAREFEHLDTQPIYQNAGPAQEQPAQWVTMLAHLLSPSLASISDHIDWLGATLTNAQPVSRDQNETSSPETLQRGADEAAQPTPAQSASVA